MLAQRDYHDGNRELRSSELGRQRAGARKDDRNRSVRAVVSAAAIG
jgi:hypothetical protein